MTNQKNQKKKTVWSERKRKTFMALLITSSLLVGGTCVVVPLLLIRHNPGPGTSVTIEQVTVKDPTALADDTTYNLAQLPTISMTTDMPLPQSATFIQMQLKVRSSIENAPIAALIAWSPDQEWDGDAPLISNYLSIEQTAVSGNETSYLLKWAKTIDFDNADAILIDKTFDLSFTPVENPSGVYTKTITIQQPSPFTTNIDSNNSYAEGAKLQYGASGQNLTQYIRFYADDSSIFSSPNFNVYFCTKFENYATPYPISQLSSKFGNLPISFSWQDQNSGLGKVELAEGGNVTLPETNNTFAIGATYTYAHDSGSTGFIDTGLISDMDEATPVVRGISILRNTYVDDLTVTGHLDLELGAGGVDSGHNTVTLSTTIHNPVIEGTPIADPVLSLPVNWTTAYAKYFSTTPSTYTPTLNIVKTSDLEWTASVTLTALATGFDNSMIDGASMNIGISTQPTDSPSPIVKSQTIVFNKNTTVAISNTATVALRATSTAGYVNEADLTYSVLNPSGPITTANWVWSGSASDHDTAAPTWTNNLIQIAQNGSSFSARLTAAAATDNATSYAPAYLWLKSSDYTNNATTIWCPTPRQFNLSPQSSITLTDTTEKFLSYNAVSEGGATTDAGIAHFAFSKSNSAQTIALADVNVTASTSSTQNENVFSNGQYGDGGTIYEDVWSNKIQVEIIDSQIVVTLRNATSSGANPVGPITINVWISCTDAFVGANTLTSAIGTTEITLQGAANLVGSASNENFIYAANGATTSTYNEFTLGLVNMGAENISTDNLTITHTFASYPGETISGLPSYMNCIKIDGGSTTATTFRIQFISDYKQSAWNSAHPADYSNISFSVSFHGTDGTGSSVTSNTLSTNATPANNLGAAVCEQIGEAAWDDSVTYENVIAFSNDTIKGTDADYTAQRSREIKFNAPGTYNFTPTADNVVAHITPNADWDTAFNATGSESIACSDNLAAAYESGAWYIKYSYVGAGSSLIANPRLLAQATATVTFDLYTGSTHDATTFLNTTSPLTVNFVGNNAVDITGNNSDGQPLITNTSFTNISTKMPSVATVGKAIWDANPTLRTYISNHEPTWNMSNMTVNGDVYSVDLSPAGIITDTSIYLFGTIRVTFTITAQDLSYWFADNDNIEWNDDAIFNIGGYWQTPTLEDLKFFFITHYTSGTLDQEVFEDYHTTFAISAPGRITLTARSSSTSFIGSVTFNYTIN